MKQLSYWAKQHPYQARTLIAICRITLALLGIFYGLVLSAFDQDWVMPLAWCAGLAYLIAFVGYPRRGEMPWLRFFPKNSSYGQRKFCDGLLALSSALFYLLLGNWLSQPAIAPLSVIQQNERPAVAWSSLERASTWQLPEDRHQFLKKVRKEARHAVHDLRAAKKDAASGSIVGLVLLSILLVVGLGYLLIAAACGLACGGQEGLAAVLLIIGFAVIVLLLVLLWRGMGRRRRGTTTG